MFKQEQQEAKPIVENEDSKLVEKIDKERNQLGNKLTPITEENFKAWIAQRKKKLDKQRKERIEAENQSLGLGNNKRMSGRELFTKQANLFTDAEDAVEVYEKDENLDIEEDLFEDEELPDFD